MIEITITLQWKVILVKIDSWYSLREWFLESIENWLNIGYTYGILKSKATRSKVWFWRVLHKEVHVTLKKPLWDKKGLWQKLYDKMFTK